MIKFISIVFAAVFSYGITKSGINEEAQLMIIIPVCTMFGVVGSLLDESYKNIKG